jgi:hypothetical protein
MNIIDSPSDMQEQDALAVVRIAMANRIAFLSSIVYRDANRDFSVSEMAIPEQIGSC